jgi:hypothetical protein
MLNLMKKKAKEAEAEYDASAKESDEDPSSARRSIFRHSANHHTRH